MTVPVCTAVRGSARFSWCSPLLSPSSLVSVLSLLSLDPVHPCPYHSQDSDGCDSDALLHPSCICRTAQVLGVSQYMDVYKIPTGMGEHASFSWTAMQLSLFLRQGKGRNHPSRVGGSQTRLLG